MASTSPGEQTRPSEDRDPESLLLLVDAIEQLSGARTVEEVAAVMRTSTRRISGADGIAFVLRDGDKCHYFDEDAIGPLWKGRRFPLSQTQRSATNPQEFVASLESRLQALARAHELLTRGAWGPASVQEVIHEALAPFRPQESRRLAIDGPEVRLSPEAALTLHMAFHELATNAAKFGAFSDDKGRLAVSWTADSATGMALSWVESGGPPVAPPTRWGFGSRLIERGLAQDLDGTSVLSFEAGGVRLDMTAPLGRRMSLA